MASETGEGDSAETRPLGRLAPGARISRYRIVDKIGAGGMGVVYRAEDTRLKRHVALKFLPPALTDNKEAKERFITEARAASALDHTNICTIHEVDESAEGQIFIAMSCYEGESLREKIQRGSLPVEEALDITLQIAAGLGEAHRKGIVHRDIKPANVMITPDGTAKIMDFGLAKLVGKARLTRTGTTLGTIAYMSPEQARGREVDHRSDIWSLGVVLFEMLSGRLPFEGQYEQAMLYCLLNEEPQALETLRPDLPEGLSRIVARALTKDPSQRYQNVAELVRDLESMSGSGDQVSGRETPEVISIVVLPFDDISPGKDHEYFSDGLTEEIIADLSRVTALRVISRTSTMQLKRTSLDVKQIGMKLKVQYVLEGSVRTAGDNLRITAQLIDAVNDSHVWAEKYAGTLEDVFDFQEEVSRSIVEALKLKLSPEEDEVIAQRPIADVEAYQFYLRARQEIWRWTETALDRALNYLKDAHSRVGENALIYAAMGYVYWQYVNAGFRQQKYADLAEEYANKAIALAPDSSQSHFLLGVLNQALKGDPAKGVYHLKRAVVADPNNADALAWLMYTYAQVGRPTAAKRLLERLLRVDPLTPTIRGMSGWIALQEGRFDEALQPIRDRYEMEPISVHGIAYALALTYNGQREEAVSMTEHVERSAPWNFYDRLLLFLLCGLNGDKSKALEYLTQDVTDTARRDPEYSWEIAVGYALIGEEVQALDWLENCINQGYINYPFLSEHDRLLDKLRKHERFGQLMARVKTEWKDFDL